MSKAGKDNSSGSTLPLSSAGGATLSRSLVSFFLAGRTLERPFVVNLLLTSSFGVNALFYAAWLGYKIGIWALAIQAAWSLSFILLIPQSEKFRSMSSLHGFIGQRFGSATKIIASICSLVGTMYLIGWEVGIGKTAISSILTSSINILPSQSIAVSEFVMIAAVAATLFYTIPSGLRGNAVADTILNLSKILIVGLLVILLFHRIYAGETTWSIDAMFPSFQSIKANFGLWALVTNVLFNVSWQFVDYSSWQSIIAGSDNPNTRTSRNLLYSSLVIFLTIGVLGTFLGISLAGASNVTPDNILPMAVLGLPQQGLLPSVAMIVLVIVCVMSLADNMLLASALILIVDILPTFRATSNLSTAHRLLIGRGTLISVAIMSVWGISVIFRLSGANLFDFVYIVILTQLALIGPVLVGFFLPPAAAKPMWIAICFGLIIGFGSAIIGTIAEESYLVDGAGTFTIAASIASAYAIGMWSSVRRRGFD